MAASKNYKVGRGHQWPDTVYVDVLYGPDKDEIMVVNKPPGMDTFQTHYYFAGYPQLCDVVRMEYPDYAHAHRIDRTTSGCHAFGTKGRGTGSIGLLKNEWTEGVTKTYLAIVGKNDVGIYPKWDEIVLTMHVAHTNGTNKPCTTTLTNLGRGCIAAELTKGGRNHQIRRALHAIGWPIVGDRKYGGAEGHRVLLHAWTWEFRDIKVQAQCPPDMEEWEPGGYTEALHRIEVPPLSIEDMARLAEFRARNPGGSMGWPLPPVEDDPWPVRYGYGKAMDTCNSTCICDGSCLEPTDEQELVFRETFGYPINHPLHEPL